MMNKVALAAVSWYSQGPAYMQNRSFFTDLNLNLNSLAYA